MTSSTRFATLAASAVLAALSGLSAVALAEADVAAGQSSPRTDELPVVVTSGVHVIRRAPDRAFATIATETRARRPQEAQQENARVMAAVLAALKAAGVGEGATRTLGVSLAPEYDYHEGRRTLRGYLARNAIEVTVDDLARLGAIIDAAVEAGATDVDGVRFDLKDRNAVEREALEQAVRDARARAEAAAAGAGRAIAYVREIVEGRQTPEPPRPMMMAARAQEADVDTPIVPGEIEIRAEVRLTAVLK